MSPKNIKSSYPLPTADPEEVGFSSKRLANIRPSLQKYIDKEMIPNVNTLVARHGKIVHYDVQGYMDFDSKTPANRDTIYRLWSNSKPITGVATMICVEEGLITLDDPVSKYIPAFANQVVRQKQVGPIAPVLPPVDRDITIRDCLRNTTGLTTARSAPLSYLMEYGDIVEKAGLLRPPQYRPDNLQDTLEALAKLPLENQPGTTFEYQVGYPIVGRILEIVTGKTLEEFYQERIFKPLGMINTSFYLDKNHLKDFPTLYRPVMEKGQWKLQIEEVPEKSEKVLGPKTYFEAGGGGGGVLSTTGDYARFAQMLLNGGELEGVKILGRKSVEIMTSSHTGDIDLAIPGPGFGFGMGVGVYLGGVTPMWRSVGTYGWGGAAGTNYFADPKEDLICCCFSQVFMHQAIPGNNYLEEFERLVYQSLT
jgi:CubicO group peptidase (beta-lactamase class C family)